MMVGGFLIRFEIGAQLWLSSGPVMPGGNTGQVPTMRIFGKIIAGEGKGQTSATSTVPNVTPSTFSLEVLSFSQGC